MPILESSGAHAPYCTTEMKIDTERVIIEVHLRPVLWDKRNELYKNRDAREAAWRDILKELAPNYENLSEEERKEAGMCLVHYFIYTSIITLLI